MIPGDPRRDGTLMFARAGASVLTGDGQRRMAQGASLNTALARQMPHFQAGGRVPPAMTAPVVPTPADAHAIGTGAGGRFVIGAAAGTVAAGAEWRMAAASVGMQVGHAAADAGGVAYAPRFIQTAEAQLAQRANDFTVPPKLAQQAKALGETPLPTGLAQQTRALQPVVSGVMAKFGEGRNTVRDFGQTAQRTMAQATTGVRGLDRATQGLANLNGPRGLNRLTSGAKAVAERFPGARVALRNFGRGANSAGDQARSAGGRITRALSDAAANGRARMGQLRATTTTVMATVHRRMSNDSDAGRKALSGNFAQAAGAMRASMALGRQATTAGLASIRSQMTRALRLYGVGERNAEGGRAGRAQGGWIGRAGQAGRDTVPIMAARGEAVVNRHQAPHIDRALAVAQATGVSPYGSLNDLFSKERRPHYMARGGFVQGANSRGLTPATLSFAQRMFARGFSVTSAKRAGGGRSYHNIGAALDFGDSVNSMQRLGRILIPMRHKFAELFGPGGSWRHGRPIPQVPDHTDHWHVALTGAVRGLGAAVDQIKRVRIRGDLGMVSQIGQAAVDRARKAANAYLEKQMMTVDGGHGTGQAAAPGQVRRWAAAALRHVNWFSPANLNALVSRIMQESGGNPRAVNNWDINAKRGDPSKGLAQTIGATFARYRDPRLPNNVFHPLANLVAALRYMKARYGRVVGANGRGYAQGGFVDAPFVGSYREGGPIRQDGIAYVHRGEYVVPRPMAQGGVVGQAAGMGPVAQVRRLNELPRDANRRAARQLKALGESLRKVSQAALDRTREEIERLVKQIRRGGVTRRERPRLRRLERALGLVSQETHRRAERGGPLTQVRAIGRLPHNADTRTDRLLKSLEEALGQTRRVTDEQVTRTRDVVLRMIRRLKRRGLTPRERPKVERLERALELVNQEVTERLQTIGSRVQERLQGAQRIGEQLERSLARRGIDPESTMGLRETSRALRSQQKILRSRVVPLQRAIRAARRAGNTDVQRELTEQLQGLQDQIADTAVQIARNARERVLRLSQERLDDLEFYAGLGRHAVAGVEARQRLMRTGETPGGMLERANAIQTRVIPHLRQQIAALNVQAWNALSVGAIDVWRQATDAAAAASNDLTNALADSADLIRDAMLRAAQDAVDAASHAVTMTDLGLTRLELEQRLAGTFETGGQQRADYIRSNVLPGLQRELHALVAQQAEANRQGDAVLAAQIAEAVAQKQNGLLQAQLDAQEAIRDSARDLREYGGTLAYQSRSQQHIDFRNTLVGV